MTQVASWGVDTLTFEWTTISPSHGENVDDFSEVAGVVRLRALICFPQLTNFPHFSPLVCALPRLQPFQNFSAISSSLRRDSRDSRNALRTHSWWSRWLLLASPSSGIDWITKHRETQVIQWTTQKWKTTRERKMFGTRTRYESADFRKSRKESYARTKGWTEFRSH